MLATKQTPRGTQGTAGIQTQPEVRFVEEEAPSSDGGIFEVLLPMWATWHPHTTTAAETCAKFGGKTPSANACNNRGRGYGQRGKQGRLSEWQVQTRDFRRPLAPVTMRMCLHSGDPRPELEALVSHWNWWLRMLQL